MGRQLLTVHIRALPDGESRGSGVEDDDLAAGPATVGAGRGGHCEGAAEGELRWPNWGFGTRHR